VVVTRGGDGCDLHPGAGPAVPIPAVPAEAVDTTGAGDAFTAALAVAMADRRPLLAAVRWAAAAGAIATEGSGARGCLPSRAALDLKLSTPDWA
jgi:ribokinase